MFGNLGYHLFILGMLIGELVLLKLVIFLASIEFSPPPLRSFMDWEYIRELDIFALFLPSPVASQLSFIKERAVLRDVLYIVLIHGRRWRLSALLSKSLRGSLRPDLSSS
jgi:hypothetical protein